MGPLGAGAQPGGERPSVKVRGNSELKDLSPRGLGGERHTDMGTDDKQDLPAVFVVLGV